jgi:exopolysaccharide/PEPCTERM locus tyrosine autokinase
MSLIEKAANRLNAEFTAPPPSDPPPAVTAPPPSVDPSPPWIATEEVPIPTQEAEESLAQNNRPIIPIDLARLRKLNILAPTGSSGEYSATAEEFRMIKRPLLNRAFEPGSQTKNANLVMITSPLPGDGKSFCALNLAISIAMEKDRTVLLVDADVSKPSQMKLLGIEADRGLMDLLQDPSLTPADVLLRTSIPNFSLLPAGRPSRTATEYLASVSMANLLDDLSGRYPDRLILFDSPPLLITTEASVLSSHMGQVVVVSNAENTTHSALKAALDLVRDCPHVGVVINRTTHQISFGDYGYWYGYGYGYGQRA